MSSRRVLVVMPNNLGDIIMCLPVVRSLKEQNPATTVDFLVESGYEGAACVETQIDHLISFPRLRIKQLLKQQTPRGLQLLTDVQQQVQQNRYDVIYNFCQHAYMASFLAPIAAAEKYGRFFTSHATDTIRGAWSEYFFAIPFSRICNNLHTTDVFLRIASARPPEPAVTSRSTDTASSAGWDVLQKCGIEKQLAQRIVVIQLGAAHSGKNPPMSFYENLIALLAKRGFTIVLSGGKAETEAERHLMSKKTAPVYSVVNQCDFATLYSVLRCARYVVSPDTATMHAASACGVETIALFGPTNPVETGPYGAGNWVVYPRYTHRLCFCEQCPHGPFKTLKAEHVLAIIDGAASQVNGIDIYKSVITSAGTWQLQPQNDGCTPLYSAHCARSIQAVLTAGDLAGLTDRQATAELKNIAESWHRMAEMLERYQQTMNTEYISQFERLKTALGGFGPLADFFSAIGNFRFNALDYSDSKRACEQSKQICLSLHHLIARAVYAAAPI